jgi:HPt (histidine-containing phosphotransfer) domain-containing protein
VTLAVRPEARVGVVAARDPGYFGAVDAAVFDSLVADLGAAHPGLREELLEGYLLQSGPQIAELVAAAAGTDEVTVGRLAHLMRSSSALLGASELAALLGMAEDAARGGSVGDLGPMATRIQQEYQRVEADLAQLLSMSG